MASLFCLLTALFVLVSQPSETPPPDDFLAEMRGQAIAQDRCATCHAIGREDASPDAEAPPFRGFRARAPLLFDDPEFRGRMTTGHPVMPDVNLSAEEIQDLTAYLRSLEDESDGLNY